MGARETVSHWHSLDGDDVLSALGVRSGQGLDLARVAERRARFGRNALPAPAPLPWWRLWVAQFQDVLVLVLLGATAISAVLGEVGDAVTIFAIVVMNAILGYLQESRAERALTALRALSAPGARVLREGRLGRVPAEELVPGDIVVVEAGDRVPADMRLLESVSLEVEESALTGESAPVPKHASRLGDARLGPADQRNMAFMGTLATRGRGLGVVVATGLDTEMGRIARLLATSHAEPTPLERRLEGLSRVLVASVLVVCIAVVVVAVPRGEPLYQMFLTGVSLGVAAIPEGLPAIVTVALALGVQRMARRHAIVRRLPAVEALGCVTVVCTDKTGTLTRNEMAVRVVWAGGEVGRAGESNTRAIDDVLTRAAECCDAQVDPGGSGRADPDADADGDPTEVAILAAAEAARPGSEGGRAERLGEVPFDAEARRMTVLLRAGQGARSVMKGAPDTVLARCRWLRRPDGTDVALTASERAAVAAAVEGMAAGALRVLAVAERPGLTVRAPVAAWEREMVFVGLIGMMDQPRPEASGALARCREAGIRVVMITGDHPRTAEAVAREVGLLDGGARVVSGPELATWDDRRLAREIPALRVLARATPPDKLRVVRALRARGEVVAMTGDGVNDAPAVKEADIGVAMGRTGTDVTKEAAAVVLADDNFATIVAAVEEGRSIYDNVRKFIRYLLACNTGEVLTMFLVALIGAPMPLLPIQILWVNLVTDGLPALALGLEPADPEGMRRPPRPPHESVFARGLGRRIVVRGLVIGTVTVALFLFALRTGHRLDYARTLAFAALTLEQLVFVFECRSESRHPWRLPLARNPWLPLAALSSLALFLLTVYVPALRPIFATVPLGATGWLLVALAALGPTIVQGLRLGGVPRTRAVRA